MPINKSEVFQQVVRDFQRALISQDSTLDKRLKEMFNKNSITLTAAQMNDVIKIMDFFQEYHRVAYMVALTESMCTFLSKSEIVINDIDFCNNKQINEILALVSHEA